MTKAQGSVSEAGHGSYSNPQKETVITPSPEHLPTDAIEDTVSLEKQIQEKHTPTLRFGFLFALTFLLIISGGVFGKTSLQSALKDIAPYASFLATTTQNVASPVQEMIDESCTTIA